MLKDIFYSIRPFACAITSLLVLGAFRPTESDYQYSIILALAAFSGSAYCFLVNDIFDRKKDLLNKKYRPIATGSLSVKSAWLASSIFASCFIVLAFFLGKLPFILSFVFLAIVTLYSFVNNAKGFVANLIVGFIVSGTQWGVAFVRPDTYLFYSSFLLFFIIVAREIMLDWLDEHGDKTIGKSSVPLRFTASQVSGILVFFYLCGSITIVLMDLLYLSTKLAGVLHYLALIALWIPFFYFLVKKERRRVLFNIRSSHLALILFLIAMYVR